ncbi:hypothetical protein BGZ96_006682 [Linnemannia gamsii]|uniref:Acid phosphatase n=1 Tax=Linnemannia gamsii TaxID=64522 RepID=A0ABQ7K217_9FUNG|nr:hypothetical protein BGZ96_006682 [Linnemannia gamsii]
MLFKKLASLALLAAAVTAQVPKGKAFDHIFIVFLENTDYDLANSDPTLRSLFKSGVVLNNFHGVTHPSQPNYLAAIAGDYFDYDDDGTHNLDTSYKTVVDLLEDKGLTWRSYQENMPSVCYTGSSSKSLYYRKHNPFISFDLISKNATRCKNVVPSTQLQTDLNAGYLPNYSFYTPNIKNDGHDTTVAYASKWFSGFLAPLLSNPTFNNNTLVVLTFDEADDYTDETNHVLGMLLGDAVKHINNTVDSTFYTQYSLISTVTSNWGLGNLGRFDVYKPLSNVFSFVAALTGYQNVDVPNPPPLN